MPPPYAWKLHFAVLVALSATALHMSNVLGLMRKLGMPPQVRAGPGAQRPAGCARQRERGTDGHSAATASLVTGNLPCC